MGLQFRWKILDLAFPPKRFLLQRSKRELDFSKLDAIAFWTELEIGTSERQTQQHNPCCTERQQHRYTIRLITRTTKAQSEVCVIHSRIKRRNRKKIPSVFEKLVVGPAVLAIPLSSLVGVWRSLFPPRISLLKTKAKFVHQRGERYKQRIPTHSCFRGYSINPAKDKTKGNNLLCWNLKTREGEEPSTEFIISI